MKCNHSVLEPLSIVVKDALDTKDSGVGGNTVQGKAVAGFVYTHVVWNATEAKGWEFPVVVISFEDLTYRLDSLLVLVEVP
jgi:hypothetical protein